jgi:hypothetical protein
MQSVEKSQYENINAGTMSLSGFQYADENGKTIIALLQQSSQVNYSN